MSEIAFLAIDGPTECYSCEHLYGSDSDGNYDDDMDPIECVGCGNLIHNNDDFSWSPGCSFLCGPSQYNDRLRTQILLGLLGL